MKARSSRNPMGAYGDRLHQPVRESKGSVGITLAPGEQKHVTFPLGFDELSFYNVELKRTVEPATYKIWVGGNSPATLQSSLNNAE